MQSARQQALLSALGIQQWIPRAAVIREVQQAGQLLWRSDEELVESDSLIASIPQTQTDIVSEHPPVLTHAGSTAISQPEHMGNNVLEALSTDFDSHHIEEMISSVGQRVQPLVMPAQFESPAVEQHIQVSPPVLSFRLQAFEINQWVVLIDEADLQQPAHLKLWQNILQAFNQPLLTYFFWPLSEGQRWQRNIGVKAAVSGFLFKLGLDKRIGLMSDLPDQACPDRMERLPYLQELLDEPLKKRLLWNLLK